MDLSLDAAALAVIVFAVSLGAVTKGITGLGLPLIGVPAIAVFLGVEHAVLVMAIPTVVTNTWMTFEHRGSRSETRHLGAMLGLGTIGAVVGTIALTRSEPAWLSLLLGATVLLYLVQRFVSPDFVLSTRVTALTAPVVGFVGGVVHGATGASGPVLATFVHGFGLPRGAFVLMITSLFQGFTLVQIATFVALGRYDTTAVMHSLTALVPILIMMPLGMRIARHIDRRRFEQVIVGLLFVMGARLLYEGFTGL